MNFVKYILLATCFFTCSSALRMDGRFGQDGFTKNRVEKKEQVVKSAKVGSKHTMIRADEQYCGALKDDLDKSFTAERGEKYKDGWSLFQETKNGTSRTITMPRGLDVHVARYQEDTQWSEWLKTQGANVTVWPAEGLDEEISYLKDLVASYDTMQATKAFLHGNAPGDWHSTRDILSVVAKVDEGKLNKLGGYASLAAGTQHYSGTALSVPMQSEGRQWQLLRYRMDCDWKDDLWVKMVKSQWKLTDEGSFAEFGGYCCSQFVVTRDAVHKFPKAFYESLLERVSSPQMWSHNSFTTIGRTLDYVWHVIFTGVMVEPRYDTEAFTQV